MEKLIPNSTQIPNEICDCVLPQIPEAEARCLIYICRRTFGFRKTQDRISFSQFEKGIKTKDGNILDYGTGLSRPAVAKALKNLCESGAIKRTENSKGNFYEINLEMECSQVVKQINWLSSLTKSGKATLPKVVNLLNTQNKEKQRETKKNTATIVATQLDFQKLVNKSEWSDRTISERPNRTLTTSPQDTHQCPDRTLHSKDTHIKDTQRKDIPATAGLPSQNSSCRNAPPQKNAAPPPPFNSRKYLKKILETDRSKHCRIIAYYALIKKIDFPTEKAVSRFIARNSKVATELAEYPKSRIDRAIDEIMGDERCATFNWGLETIIKKIAK